MLSHVEITGDFDFKDQNNGNHFLAAMPVKSTAESQHALSSNKRNRVALQVKCSWKRNKPKVNTSNSSNIVHCCSQNYLSLPWQSLFTHVGAFFLSYSFLSFSFFLLFTCKLFCFYSTTPTPSSPGFMRMKWNQLLSSSFFLFFFFLLLSIFIAKKRELARTISLIMFVLGCVQKLASKIASFFAPKLLSLGARLRPR